MMRFGTLRGRWSHYNEETQAEGLKFKLMLFAGVAFLVTAYYSYRELKYLVWGKTVEATVTRVYIHEEPGRHGRKKAVQVVEYTFTDHKNAIRSERDAVPKAWQVTAPLVAIQYLPNENKSSRLRGNSHPWSVVIFLGCIGWLVYSFVQLYREANAPIPRAGRASQTPRRNRVREF